MGMFNPNNMAEGGLLQDLDAKFMEVGFVMWDYNGQQKPGPALQVNLMDLEGKMHTQYFSAGDSKFFVPSDDNTTLVPVGDRNKLASGSNFGKLMTSLVNCGYPADRLDSTDNIQELLTGLEVHLIRETVERKGMVKSPRPGEKEPRPDTVLVVSQIHHYPWDQTTASLFDGVTPQAADAAQAPGQAKGAPVVAKVAPKGAPAGIKPVPAAGKPATAKPTSAAPAKPAAATPKANGAAPVTVDDDELSMSVNQVIGEQGGAVTKARLGPLLFAAITDKVGPEKQAMLKRALETDFLESGGVGGGMWSFDGGTLSAVA